MRPLGWRFVVVTDPGKDMPSPARVTRETLEAAVPAEPARLGLSRLLEHAAEAVEIEVLSAGARDAAARLRQAVHDPEMAALRTPVLSLIVVDHDYGPGGEDLKVLSELAEIGQALQAPVVAGASPSFFGLKQVTLLPKLNDLPARLSDAAHAGWQKFQKTDAARWLVLTVNRFLLRDEREGEPAEARLWGRGGWLVAAAVARAVREQGHALDVSGLRAGRFEGLPTWPYPKLANQCVPLPTETPIPEQTSLELSRVGFVALAGQMGAGAVTVPLAVNAHRTAPGRLTVSGTLGYQLMAARLAQVCTSLLDELPPDPAAATELLRRTFGEVLGSLLGDAPEEAVRVTPVEVKDAAGASRRAAEVVLRPAAKLEGMDLQFAFQLPLR